MTDRRLRTVCKDFVSSASKSPPSFLSPVAADGQTYKGGEGIISLCAIYNLSVGTLAGNTFRGHDEAVSATWCAVAVTTSHSIRATEAEERGRQDLRLRVLEYTFPKEEIRTLRRRTTVGPL